MIYPMIMVGMKFLDSLLSKDSLLSNVIHFEHKVKIKCKRTEDKTFSLSLSLLNKKINYIRSNIYIMNMIALIFVPPPHTHTHTPLSRQRPTLQLWLIP